MCIHGLEYGIPKLLSSGNTLVFGCQIAAGMPGIIPDIGNMVVNMVKPSQELMNREQWKETANKQDGKGVT